MTASEAQTRADQAPQASSPVTLIPQTKFMQNFRIASAANAGTEAVSIANGNRDVELFTVGSDGKIWNFYPDPASETGYSGVDTGLTGTAVAAGVDSTGHIVVFAAQGLVMGYVTETGKARPERWSAPKTCTVPLPSGAQSITKIDAAEIEGHLLVAALVSSTGPLHQTLYHLVYADWPTDGGAPKFNQTVVAITTMNCVWTGSAYANAAYTILDTVILQFTISTGRVTRPALSGTFSSIDVDTVLDRVGNNEIFAVLNDGNAYRLIGGGKKPLSWAQLTTLQSFKQVRAVLDYSGAVHVFLLGTNNVVYHLEPSAEQPSGFLSPSQIFAKTVQLAVTTNASGLIDLFAVGSSQNVITHLFREETGGGWQNERLEVATNGQVEAYASYTTDVQITDAAGTPLTNTPINVWSSDETRLTVNGSTFFIGPKRPARVNTNDVATVSLAQEVGALSAPTILISVPSLMSPGESVAVEQSVDVQTRLKTASGTDLLNANGSNGQPILTGRYRNQDTADAIMSHVNQCMEIAVSSIAASPSLHLLHAKRAGTGASYYRGDPADAALIRFDSVPEKHWQIAFDGPNVRFQVLTSAETNALLAEKRASFPKANGILHWFEDIGDFIAGVAQGLASVIDVIVTTVSKGINAVITFIVDGVTYIFETIIKGIEQAFALAETIFAQVKIYFEQLYEWLAFLFNWNDILRTHEALAYAIDQMLGFLTGAVGGIQTIIDNGISTLQTDLQTWFQNAIQNIAGSQTLGSYSDANEQKSPQYINANANNIIYNHVIDNASGSISLRNLAQERDLEGPIDQFMQQLRGLVELTQSSAAFNNALDYFKNLGGSPDQIFNQMLAGLMSIAEGVLQAILSGVKAIIDALLQLVQSLVNLLREALNEEWSIPFVSSFYSWITNGAKLSTLDLVALIAAIPTTILYKAIYGSVPFPDENSVNAFKASFNAQSMVAATGLGPRAAAGLPQPVPAEGEGAWTGLIAQPLALLVTVGGTVCEFLYQGLSAVLDGHPPGVEAPKLMTYGALIAEIGAQAAAFPWFITSGDPNCNDSDGRSKILWIYQNLGVLLDAVYLYLDGKMPENNDDIGVIVTFIYSLGHLGAAISASVGQSGLPVAVNILPVMPEMTKLLRLTSVVEASEEISLVVLTAFEGIMAFVIPITTFVSVRQQINAVGMDPELQRFLVAETGMGETGMGETACC